MTTDRLYCTYSSTTVYTGILILIIVYEVLVYYMYYITSISYLMHTGTVYTVIYYIYYTYLYSTSTVLVFRANRTAKIAWL